MDIATLRLRMHAIRWFSPGANAIADVPRPLNAAHQYGETWGEREFYRSRCGAIINVAELLRRMNLPKRVPPSMALRYPGLTRICGKPVEILLDNAAEFTGHSLEDAAKSASFSVCFCPIRMPRYRAIVERVHATIEGKMLEELPGATGSIQYRRKSGHDPEDLACVVIDEIEALANWPSPSTTRRSTRASAPSRRSSGRGRPAPTASTSWGIRGNGCTER